MSRDDLYPANQWRYNRRHHNHPHSQPHPQYNRPPRCRRRPSAPICMRSVGPRLGMLGLINLFSPSNNIPNRPPAPRPKPHSNYPYSMCSQPQNKTVIIDTLKKGFMEIEHHILFKYYRNKYFLLKSDSKLYFFSAPNNIYSKADGMIDLLHVISLKKLDKNMLELQVNNKSAAGNVDIVQLLTADTTLWRLKCIDNEIRNDWFDCIACLVSQNKNVAVVEREKEKESKMEDDEWCVVEKKENGIFSKVLSRKKVFDNGLDLDAIQPEPGMNDEFIAPPAYAPHYDANGNLNINMNMEGNHGGDGVVDYGNEGKVTLQ